ncbi:P-loop containing NTP hydrolase pore-1-domain-containing protein [Pavlovales sp. CCMP2436]|nr:P-loop containing NTP hydrolase pore-1-domain-containing protein [Pavlovales sp. CCMP2436]
MGGPVGTAHPETIVEAAAMASVSPPEPTYRPKLDESLLLPPAGGGTSRLSSVQFESVVYAGQAHQGTCEPVEGLTCARGFYIGDGTGVGKGRQIAGVILDNWMQGRRRAVWVSISAELLYDCRRDLKDLCEGLQEIPVFPLHKLPYGQLDADEGIGDGVLFTSYSALIAANKQNERRLDQIVSWAAGGSEPALYAGVIALDECHKAKHAATDGRLRPTKTGEAVIELQRRLPRARVLYVSATAASEVKDLAYMERLGLWGKGAPFPSFADFTNEMSRGGMCAMELLAMDLKARGLLVSRMLAFSGCSYEISTATLTLAQRHLYDSAAELWLKVSDTHTENMPPPKRRHGRGLTLTR